MAVGVAEDASGKAGTRKEVVNSPQMRGGSHFFIRANPFGEFRCDYFTINKEKMQALDEDCKKFFHFGKDYLLQRTKK